MLELNIPQAGREHHSIPSRSHPFAIWEFSAFPKKKKLTRPYDGLSIVDASRSGWPRGIHRDKLYLTCAPSDEVLHPLEPSRGRSRALRFRDRNARKHHQTRDYLSARDGHPACVTRKDICCPLPATPLGRRDAHPSRPPVSISLALSFRSSFSLSRIHGIVTLAPRTRNVQGGAWKSGDLAPVSMKTATVKGTTRYQDGYHNDSLRLMKIF